jgi:hypothetical protein
MTEIPQVFQQLGRTSGAEFNCLRSQSAFMLALW